MRSLRRMPPSETILLRMTEGGSDYRQGRDFVAIANIKMQSGRGSSQLTAYGERQVRADARIAKCKMKRLTANSKQRTARPLLT